MKPTILLLAAAAVSLILQDRPQAREVSTAKKVYAEELVLHEDGRADLVMDPDKIGGEVRNSAIM